MKRTQLKCRASHSTSDGVLRGPRQAARVRTKIISPLPLLASRMLNPFDLGQRHLIARLLLVTCILR